MIHAQKNSRGPGGLCLTEAFLIRRAALHPNARRHDVLLVLARLTQIPHATSFHDHRLFPQTLPGCRNLLQHYLWSYAHYTVARHSLKMHTKLKSELSKKRKPGE